MKPTKNQLSAIKRLHEKFEETCRENPTSERVCSFIVMSNPNWQEMSDENITVVDTSIFSYDDNGGPLTITHNLLIQPDGDVTDLREFMTMDEQAEYLSKLQKLKFNE